ncbi:hypothetical protein QYE76_062269 [Lolium multiflorum]|uniref:Uncharacterized protein n=1 Tax=Lolium multiflorum TaxID=4521 RepID=A0AAD8W807_LOLMU|nr:hypothetical protein QYE76_062269 [Lolium multiflorum]
MEAPDVHIPRTPLEIKVDVVEDAVRRWWRMQYPLNLIGGYNHGMEKILSDSSLQAYMLLLKINPIMKELRNKVTHDYNEVDYIYPTSCSVKYLKESKKELADWWKKALDREGLKAGVLRWLLKEKSLDQGGG